MPLARSTRTQVARDHAALAARSPERLTATALRTKSLHAREIFTSLVLPGTTLPELLHWAEDRPERLARGMDPFWVGRLATVLTLQTGQPPDVARGMALFSAAEGSGVLELLDGRDLEVMAQWRLLAGDRAGTLRLLDLPQLRPAVVHGVLADLANPALFPIEGSWEGWKASFDVVVGNAQAGGLHVADGGTTPFDRLTAPGEPVEDPHRATVVMSAYQPGPQLVTAVRSVLGQTWTNLELFVVDDASGPDHQPVLDEVEAMDPRVTVIRKGVNGGTYRARNTALRRATGDFFTVVDSDDWVHPRFVELSINKLLQNPRLPAVRSQGMRVTESLQVTRPGYVHRFVTAPSLTVRVDPVLHRLGMFDQTRKGADTEYARRVHAAFGIPVRNVHEVLTFMRAAPGSLSAAEYSRGWRHPSRHAYKSAYGPWHEAIAKGHADPFLDPDEPRRFPQPIRWQDPERGSVRLRAQFDVVLGGDWRWHCESQRSMLEEIRACRDAGLRVGIMHLEAFRHMTDQDLPLCASATDLIADGSVSWVQPDDDVDIDVLMIRPPTILQYPPLLSGSVSAFRVLIMADQAPVNPDGSDQRYVMTDVTARTRDLFGVEPQWVPQDAAMRRVLREQDPDVRLSDWDNPGLIDVPTWQVRHRHAPDIRRGPLVVGHYSPQCAGKDPAERPEDPVSSMLGPGYRARGLGGGIGGTRSSEHAGDNLLTSADATTPLPDNAVNVREFLADLDFFFAMDHPHIYESSSRILLEAAASGVLTIAGPEHRDTFGEALDYAPPHQVKELLDRYTADPAAYRQRVQRSLREVERRFGHAGFATRMSTIAHGAARWHPGREPLSPSPLGLGWWPPEGYGGVDSLRAVQVPLRSAGDGEQADAMAVVLAPDGDVEAVGRWLSYLLMGHPDALVPQVAVGTAPVDVSGVLVRRASLVEVAARASARMPDVPCDPDALGAPGLQVPEGWVRSAWWSA